MFIAFVELKLDGFGFFYEVNSLIGVMFDDTLGVLLVVVLRGMLGVLLGVVLGMVLVIGIWRV